MKMDIKYPAVKHESPEIISTLRCLKCGTTWISDSLDYNWMKDSVPIKCSCGEIMCIAGDLKKEDPCDYLL